MVIMVSLSIKGGSKIGTDDNNSKSHNHDDGYVNNYIISVDHTYYKTTF